MQRKSNCSEKENIYVYMTIIEVKREENWKNKEEKDKDSALRKTAILRIKEKKKREKEEEDISKKIELL